MNAAQRDAMVARVKATFDRHPTWASLPIVSDRGDVTILMQPDIIVDGQVACSQAAYVAALYELCATCNVVGRSAEGTAITGNLMES